MTVVSWRKQLTLAIVLFVLGTFAYWLEFKHKPDLENQEEAQKKLFNIKEKPVQSITLNTTGTLITLNCLDGATKLCKSGDNSKWEIATPLKVRADDSNANSLLTTLNNLVSANTIELKDETAEKKRVLLKEYGLDPDSLKFARRVEIAGPQVKTTLYLGATHPIGEGIFSLLSHDGKLDDLKVYVIPSFFKSTLDHDVAYWRDKKLMNLTSREVKSFHLKSRQVDVTGEKTKEGQWNLKSKGEELSGDTETIESLLNSASFLSAKNFTSDLKTGKKARDALKGTETTLELTLQKEGGSPVILTLHEKPNLKKLPNLVYATVSSSDPLYELELNNKNRLDKNLDQLRLSKLITSLERFTAKRVEFQSKGLGTPLILNHVDAKWTFEDKKDVDNEKVQKTLDKLSGNQIREFLEGSKIPSGEASGLKFTLGTDKSPTQRQLVFWKTGGKLYARDLQSKRREAFVVDTSVQDTLPWQPGYYTPGKK